MRGLSEQGQIFLDRSGGENTIIYSVRKEVVEFIFRQSEDEFGFHRHKLYKEVRKQWRSKK
jgi:hypothetical protein